MSLRVCAQASEEVVEFAGLSLFCWPGQPGRTSLVIKYEVAQDMRARGLTDVFS